MTPQEITAQLESNLLGCCMLDAEVIDKAIQAGVGPSHWVTPAHRAQWIALCDLRLAGKDTTAEGLYAAFMGDVAKMSTMGGLAGITGHTINTTIHAADYIASLCDLHIKRQAHRMLSGALESLKNGGGEVAKIREAVEKVAEICSPETKEVRPLAVVADEAITEAREIMDGKQASRIQIFTGLPTFDRYAGPIEAWEYVVVGGRSSHGKSSLMLQIAGHNLGRGLRVAIFTLETSDRSVIKQIAAQRARVNLRQFSREPYERQEEYLSKLETLKGSKNLLVFDRDTRLSALQSRFRLLATTFKPHLVVVDYLGLIDADGGSIYEKVSNISRSMIEARKILGCALMLGGQLGRGVEKEERPPTRTDFRDSGSIEQDAHKLIVTYREPGQPLDADTYQHKLYQLKNRDGPLAMTACQFHAPTTRFFE